MATYGAIQTRVQQIIIDLPSSVTAQVPTLVKEAVRSLQVKHNFKVMEALSSFTTAADTRVLGSMPSNFKEFRGKPYELTGKGRHRPLDIATDRSVAEGLWGSSSAEAEDAELAGAPRLILLAEPSDEHAAASYEIYPRSDSNSDWEDSSAGEYRIRIPYWKYLTELSADADYNWFTTNADTFIVWRAAAEGFFNNWDEERGTLWTQKASTEFQEVLRRDKQFRLSGVQTLIANPNAALPRPIR